MKTSIRSTSKSLVLLTALAVFTALTVGCAGMTALPKLSARVQPNQQLIYEDGVEKIISMRSGSIVSIRMAEPMSGRSAFVVGVSNQSSAPIVIEPEMVTVSQMGRNLRVLPYEEVTKLEQAKASRARTQGALLSVLSGVSAMAGVPVGNLSSLQGALQTAQTTMMTATQANVSKAASTAELNLKELSTVALKKNTIFPEQMGGGVVYADKRGPGPITIRVQIAQDIHDFEFAL
jgi:hypothetical protein